MHLLRRARSSDQTRYSDARGDGDNEHLLTANQHGSLCAHTIAHVAVVLTPFSFPQSSKLAQTWTTSQCGPRQCVSPNAVRPLPAIGHHMPPHVLCVDDEVVAKFPAFRGILAPNDANPYFAATVARINPAGGRVALSYTDGDYSDDVRPDEIFYAPGRLAAWGKGALRGNDMLPEGAQPVKLPLSEAQLRKQFAVFDADGSGKLTEAEVLAVLTRQPPGGDGATGAPLSEHDARQLVGSMLTQYDSNGDGCLSIEEYARATTLHSFVCPLCHARKLPDNTPARDRSGDDAIDPAELAAIEEALQNVSERYGLTFKWDVPPPGGNGKPCSKRLLRVFAPVFLHELTLYPPSLFLMGEQADGGYDWVNTIYLCEDVKMGDSLVGGFAGGQNLVVNASALSPDECMPSEWEVANFKETFHHELFHLLDFCMLHHKLPFYSEWDALNPAGFSYTPLLLTAPGPDTHRPWPCYSPPLAPPTGTPTTKARWSWCRTRGRRVSCAATRPPTGRRTRRWCTPCSSPSQSTWPTSARRTRSWPRRWRCSWRSCKSTART